MSHPDLYGLDLDDVDLRFQVIGKLRELLRKPFFEDEKGENGSIASAFVADEIRAFVQRRMRELMGVKDAPKEELFTEDQLTFLRLLFETVTIDDLAAICDAARVVAAGPVAPAAPAPAPPRARPTATTLRPLPSPELDLVVIPDDPEDDAPPASIKISSPSSEYQVAVVKGPRTVAMPQGRAMEQVSAMHAGESAEAGLKTMDKKFRQ